MSEPTIIASYDDPQSAQNLVDELVRRGFHAGVFDETAEQALKFYTAHSHAQYRVTVPDEESIQALVEFEQMEPYESPEHCPVKNAIRCPDCHSTRVEFPQFSRNTIVGSLPSIAVAVGLVDANFYCQKCHFTWKPENTEAALPDS